MPEYIFFRTESDEQIPRLPRSTNALKLLEYDNLCWELTGGDKEFAKFLFENNLLQLSHVTFIDGRIHFEDGFFYGYGDAVLHVNRRKETAEVRLGIDGLELYDDLIPFIETGKNDLVFVDDANKLTGVHFVLDLLPKAAIEETHVKKVVVTARDYARQQVVQKILEVEKCSYRSHASRYEHFLYLQKSSMRRHPDALDRHGDSCRQHHHHCKALKYAQHSGRKRLAQN